MREAVYQLDLDVKRVARANQVPELGVMDTRYNRYAADGERLWRLPRDQYGARLQRGLTQQHARQHGPAGKMSAEHVEVARNVLSGCQPIWRFLDHFVDPQKRIAMRNQSADFVSGQHAGPVRNLSTSLATMTP